MTITRIDGTKTWARVPSGLFLHDIGHYVVEKQLGLKRAFFGIINSGVEISDFEKKQEKKDYALLENLPIEALQVEHMVNLLQIEYLQGLDKENFVSELNQILNYHNIPTINGLDRFNMKSIREEYYILARRIQELRPEDRIDLTIEMSKTFPSD